MIEILKIENKELKSQIAVEVLEDLTSYFDVVKSRENYILEVIDLDFWAAFKDEELMGFITLSNSSEDCGEVHFIGVKLKYQNYGIGTALFSVLENYARKKYEYIQVKTVNEGLYEECDRIISFYKSLGFKKLEVFPDLWDSTAPCLIMVKKLEKKVPIPEEFPEPELKKKSKPWGRMIALVLALIFLVYTIPFGAIFTLKNEKKRDDFYIEMSAEESEPLRNIEIISVDELNELVGNEGFVFPSGKRQNVLFLFVEKDSENLEQFENLVKEVGNFIEVEDGVGNYPIHVELDIDAREAFNEIVEGEYLYSKEYGEIPESLEDYEDKYFIIRMTRIIDKDVNREI